MDQTNQNAELTDLPELSWDNAKVSFTAWMKILVLTLIVPMWIVIMINEGAVLWKIVSWFQLNIEFWNIKKYLFLTIAIAAIPLVYLYWFYCRVVIKTLKLLHENFLTHLNKVLGKMIAKSILHPEGHNKQEKIVAEVLNYLNRQISKLPGFLAWAARKLIDQIPFLDFVNSYTIEDFNNQDEEKIGIGIAEKIDKLMLTVIDELMPGWTKYILPVNVILLFLYFSL